MSRFNDFIERLEDALGSEEGRDAFVEYLRGMTPGERAELLAEAERRDPEGAAELAREVPDRPEAVGRRKARSEKGSKPAGKKRDGKE